MLWPQDTPAEPIIEEIPADMLEEAKAAHEAMVEKVVETDDKLLHRYLEEHKITPEELRTALRAATIANKVVPVLCGAALRNKGVQPMLDAIVDYLPSPLDVPPVEGVDPKSGEPLVREPRDDEAFAALAFKIMSDPFVGKLAFFRVYSGFLKAGDTIYNPTKDRRERIGRIILMHANDREDVEFVATGDIAAAVGLKQTFTGDTLCDPDKPVVLETIKFPEPVIQIAVEPKTKADEEKMSLALARLAEEDPTFRVHTDPESAQTLISGMGELHLEVIVDRMRREFKVAANVGRPQVAYREAITKAVKAEGRYVKQSGGKGQYGHVIADFEPLAARRGLRVRLEGQGPGPQQGMVEGDPAGHQGIDGERRHRRLPGGRPQGHRRRRVAARRRLERDGLQDRRLAGAEGRGPARQPGHRRADHEGRGRRPAGVHGRHHRRPQQPPRPRRGYEERGNASVITAFVPLATMFGYMTEPSFGDAGPRHRTRWSSITTKSCRRTSRTAITKE